VGPVEEKGNGLLVTFCDPEGKRALSVAIPLIVLASTRNSRHGTNFTATSKPSNTSPVVGGLVIAFTPQSPQFVPVHLSARFPS